MGSPEGYFVCEDCVEEINNVFADELRLLLVGNCLVICEVTMREVTGVNRDLVAVVLKHDVADVGMRSGDDGV